MHAFARCRNGRLSQVPRRGGALIRWLRKHKVGTAAMEASGGYERDWAKALREAGIEARVVDPKRGTQLRPICRAARQERSDRCADDRLVRRGLYRGAGPDRRYGT